MDSESSEDDDFLEDDRGQSIPSPSRVSNMEVQLEVEQQELLPEQTEESLAESEIEAVPYLHWQLRPRQHPHLDSLNLISIIGCNKISLYRKGDKWCHQMHLEEDVPERPEMGCSEHAWRQASMRTAGHPNDGWRQQQWPVAI